MTEAEYEFYWKPISEMFVPEFRTDASDGSVEASRLIARALGFEYPDAAWWQNIRLTYDQKQALLKIKHSPHWKTLIAVMLARREGVEV